MRAVTQHDFRPAFRRLSDLMGWDDLPTGPPPITLPAPRPIPPARQDAVTVQRRAEWLKALARATRGHA